MISENFIFLALLINFIGSAGYTISALRGKTKPNRVTWFLWTLIPTVAFFAQLDEGVGLQSLYTLAVGLGPLFVFTASFLNKKAYWQITNMDIGCGILSVFALLLWLGTGSGIIAILLSIFADFLAAIPTLMKSFNFPDTENSVVYRNATVGSTITLLTIDNWVTAEYAFALYIFITCLILYLLIKFNLGLKLKAHFGN